MNRFLTYCFAVALLPLLALPASAAPCWEELGIEPLNILFWNGPEKLCGYQNMERLWSSNTIARGNAVAKGSAPAAPLARSATAVPSAYRKRAEAFMAKNGVHGLLVMHKDAVVLEAYRGGFTENSRWTSFSMAKSLTALLAGAAVADGRIKSLDDRVAAYLPDLAKGAYATVTIRQILTMTSGVAWNENYRDQKSDVAKLADLTNLAGQADGANSFLAYMASRPRAAKAGSVFNYSTGEAGIVGYLVRRATGTTLAAYMSEKIWSQLGMEQDAIWITDQGGAEISGCCFSATLRDYARIGRFMLHNGAAGGKAVLPEWWMQEMTRASAPSRKQKRPYGYQIWVRDKGSYQASGIFGQMIHVDPANDTVIVMLSAWDTAVGTAEQHAARRAFIAEVKTALKKPGKAKKKR